MKKRLLLLVGYAFLLFIAVRSATPVYAVACSFPISPANGDWAVSESCSITADSLDGLDYANNVEEATTNPASITVPTGVTLTIPSGILGSTILATGSLILTGGTVVVGSANAIVKLNTPLYAADADADGWPNDTTYFTATASGRRRLSLMRSRATADCLDSAYSPGNSCGKRRDIALTYSGTELTNYDIVFSVDTATSIAAGNMSADCGDIRMKDSDGTTALSYWIEGGCNTTTTQVWTRVPSIPDGGKTIYMDYDGTTATDGFEAWAGTFTLMYNASCPAGWTQNADFDTGFPYGSATYGTTGGSASHAHNAVSCTTSSGGGGGGRTGGGVFCTQTHSHSGADATIGTNSNVLPPYLDVVMCKKADLVVPASFISLFDTAVPAGWTRFSALDGKHPRGSTTYGATGGATTHTHTKSGGATNNQSSGSNVCQGSTCEGDYAIAHHHTVTSGTTGAGTNTPPYLDMIFGQKNSQGAATAGLITITDVIPPLGWTRFSALDSKFPRGASVYGGTGGAATHTHSVSLATGGPSATKCGLSGSQTGGGYNHTHSCTATTNAVSNLPPYANAIFAERNTPLPTASVGEEQ
jgi:hypothetical protein